MNSITKDYLISIAIPIHKTDNGEFFLRELLNSIKKQDYKNFEVIISDSSNEDVYKKVINEFEDEFKILHIPSKFKTLARNASNALSEASGDIVKPMFSDDIFLNKNCLNHINDIFNYKKISWMAMSSYDFRSKINNKIVPLTGRVPMWNKKLLIGKNTIGAPSVIAYRSEFKEGFDINLRYLIDCDFYFRLMSKYGEPYFSSKYYIGIRHHQEQETELINNIDKLKEKIYLIYKYTIKKIFTA